MSYVRRLRADGGAPFTPKVGEPYVHPDGHVWVDLFDDDDIDGEYGETWRLCDLIAAVCLDVDLLSVSIYHLDGDPENNALDNLGWRPLAPGQLPMSPNE